MAARCALTRCDGEARQCETQEKERPQEAMAVMKNDARRRHVEARERVYAMKSCLRRYALLRDVTRYAKIAVALAARVYAIERVTRDICCARYHQHQNTMTEYRHWLSSRHRPRASTSIIECLRVATRAFYR